MPFARDGIGIGQGIPAVSLHFSAKGGVAEVCLDYFLAKTPPHVSLFTPIILWSA